MATLAAPLRAEPKRVSERGLASERRRPSLQALTMSGTEPTPESGLPGVILMLAANPTDRHRLALGREFKHLQEHLRGRGADRLRHLPEARANELVRVLLDQPDIRIVHFSGHGTPEGQLLFEDLEGRAQAADEPALAEAFAEFGHIECVFLNACHSAHQAKLIGRHVEWVVGMDAGISDEAAIDFATLFYVALAEGKAVDAAFRIALADARLGEFERAEVPMLYHHGAIHRGARRQPRWTQQPLDAIEVIEANIAQATLCGEDTRELTARLLDLRRQLRSGPSLAKGDMLAERYEIGEQAGSGAFATVWKAYDHDPQRRQLVAVKVLRGQWSNDRSRRERFASGSRRMNELAHPALVRVLDLPTEVRGHYFYVLPWFANGDLRQALLKNRVDTEVALEALAHVLEGLQHAHDHGVVHRDIKPSNILIDAQGRGALSDFDLARAEGSSLGTRTGALGTFVYAAPEQLRDASNVDARADIYSVGLSIMFVLARRDPPALVTRVEPKHLATLRCSPVLREALSCAAAYQADARTLGRSAASSSPRSSGPSSTPAPAVRSTPRPTR